MLHKKVIEENIPLDLNLTEEYVDFEIKKIGEFVDHPGPVERVEEFGKLKE